SDCRMMQDCALDLEWSNPVGGALDHIVGAALEPEISGLVAVGEIARGDPAVPEELARALRIVPITERVVALFTRPMRLMDDLSGRQLAPVLIDDGHLEARNGYPHRAVPDLDIERIEIAKRQSVFTRAEVILGRDPERLLEEADDLGIERLAATA